MAAQPASKGLFARLYETHLTFLRESRLVEVDVHWVMNLAAYKEIRAGAARVVGGDDDPDAWVPSPDDMLLGSRITVRDDGGEPHLEALPFERWHAYRSEAS